MTVEEIQYYIKSAKEFVPMGSTIGRISIIPGPVKPFETTEYYIQFQMFTNLFASEKLSELKLEKFFECCDVMMNKRDGYEEWKKRELRNYRLSLIIE
jgi:hypothetical protein